MPFNPYDHPLAWIDPWFLSGNADFVGHIPFAMALVDMARPRTIVELGTFGGNSYCAFCQAVSQRQLPTRCVAVDTWQGDPSLGAYDGNQIFADLRNYHDPKFGQFSRLMRMTFDEAVGHFPAGSIDLLHIDGCHTYEAVSHDFFTWLCKLSPAGVVIMHDTSEHREGFGVWRFWQEISARYPSFNFDHCHGLGVLVVGPQPVAPLQSFMKLMREAPAQVREFFAYAGSRIEWHQIAAYLLNHAFQTQSLLNQWCSRNDLPVNPQGDDFAWAQRYPAEFSLSLLKHARSVLT